MRRILIFAIVSIGLAGFLSMLFFEPTIEASPAGDVQAARAALLQDAMDAHEREYFERKSSK